jgi:hypothetical protein
MAAAALTASQAGGARLRPGRQLPAWAPVIIPCGQPEPRDEQCRDYGAKGRHKAQLRPG